MTGPPKARWFDPEGTGQLDEGACPCGALSSLELADCRAMERGSNRRLFLREADLLAATGDVAAKPLGKGHHASSR
jgi:hypothetical protein